MVRALRKQRLAMKEEIALITGCTSGIGLYLAHQFAKHGHPVVLVAPDAGELDRLAAELESSYGVTAHTIARNLEEPTAVDEIYDELSQSGIEIHILANNAGHGFWGKSWELPVEQDISMIRLNIEAPVRMTKR
ncbi:MAG: short-chain dehydrogenase/reductase, partial [Akkermansiaceae bacterium]|nr:short-chain dehydrogenase/reductase [Akkermansiaceae bacterium]